MSTKLLTPVQYGLVLGSLNKARPLSLADEGRVILSYPVLNTESVSNEKTSRGKFLRCQNGNALVNNPNQYSGYQYYTRDIFSGETLFLGVTYDPPVQGILLEIYIYAEPCWMDWTNYDHTEVIAFYESRGYYWIPFTGKEFRFKILVVGPGELGIKLYGFYGKDI